MSTSDWVFNARMKEYVPTVYYVNIDRYFEPVFLATVSQPEPITDPFGLAQNFRWAWRVVRKKNPFNRARL